MTELRIGIVGCGAVTTKSHLPALQTIEGIRLTALADPQLDRTRQIAARFGVPKAVSDYQELMNDVDALVLALPHHLHASIGAEILKAGKHVLMEKPLANSVEECDRLISAAVEGKAVLTVGQVRRYMKGYEGVKQWIGSGILGDLIGFEAEEGGIYNWPVASDFFFHPRKSGGGVLTDTGAHLLDALLWWLGELEVMDYQDDNAGGVEADCTLGLRSEAGFTGKVILSRIRCLNNTCILRGTRADLEVSLLSNQAQLIPHDVSVKLNGTFSSDPEKDSQSTLDLFREQANQWIKSLRGEPAEITTPEEARKTVSLIRSAYEKRVRKRQSWQKVSFGADHG